MTNLTKLIEEELKRTFSAYQAEYHYDSWFESTIKNDIRNMEDMDLQIEGATYDDVSEWLSAARRQGFNKGFGVGTKNYPKVLKALKVAIDRIDFIGSMCGIPDARDACYKINRQSQNVLDEIKEILEEK